MAQTGRRRGKIQPTEAREIKGLADIGRAFDDLAGELSQVAQSTYDVPPDDQNPDPRLVALRLEQLMETVARHRDQFAYWERVIAEYAMHRHGYSQRKTSELLSVGFPTVNRWSQHPVSGIPAARRTASSRTQHKRPW